MARVAFALAATAAFVQMQQYGIIAIALGFVLLSISFCIKIIQKKISFSPTLFLIIGFLLVSIITLKIFYLFILLGYWLAYKFFKKQTTLIVDTNGLQFKQPIITKNILWNTIEYIVLKDGLLTINYTNNRFFQSEITNIDTEINELEFNQFCNKQVYDNLKNN